MECKMLVIKSRTIYVAMIGSFFLLSGCSNLQVTKRAEISEFMYNAIDRLTRVYDLTKAEKANIIRTFKELPLEKIDEVESLCEVAFEKLAPSKCDRELLIFK